MSRVIRLLALIAASARGGNTGFGGSGLLGLNERQYSRQAGLVCQKIRLNI